MTSVGIAVSCSQVNIATSASDVAPSLEKVG